MIPGSEPTTCRGWATIHRLHVLVSLCNDKQAYQYICKSNEPSCQKTSAGTNVQFISKMVTSGCCGAAKSACSATSGTTSTTQGTTSSTTSAACTTAEMKTSKYVFSS